MKRLSKTGHLTGILVPGLLGLALLLPSGAMAQYKDPVVEGSADNPTSLSGEPVPHSSARGEFRVVFPSGCAKLAIKTPQNEPSS